MIKEYTLEETLITEDLINNISKLFKGNEFNFKSEFTCNIGEKILIAKDNFNSILAFALIKQISITF